MDTPANDNARNVLSQEELDFLLSPQTGDEATDTPAQTNARGKKPQSKRGAQARKARGADQDVISATSQDSAETREQKRFFALALERALRRATGHFVGVRFDRDTTLAPTAMNELAGAPACFVELASRRGEGIVFCLDNHAAQALANASLGAGHGPARVEGPLSLLDRELVQRCLDDLGEAYAQAFDCPCAARVRLAWHADEMFRAKSDVNYSAAEFSMETRGQLGRAWLLAPEGAA